MICHRQHSLAFYISVLLVPSVLVLASEHFPGTGTSVVVCNSDVVQTLPDSYPQS